MRKNSQRKLFRKTGIEKPKETTHSQTMKKLLVREPKAKPDLTGKAWQWPLSIFDPRYEDMVLFGGKPPHDAFQMPMPREPIGRPILIGTGGGIRRDELRAMRDMFYEPKYMAAVDPIDSDTRMLQSMFISAAGRDGARVVYAEPTKNPYGTLTKQRLRETMDSVWEQAYAELADDKVNSAEYKPLNLGEGLFASAARYCEEIKVFEFPSGQVWKEHSCNEWYREYMKFNGLSYDKYDKLFLIRQFENG